LLSELTIRDFAIIDHVSLRFDPGFNVLTGETGAGKSIIIDAVSLLLGARGSSDFVRTGADQSMVEGHFCLDGEVQSIINPLLEQEGLEGDDPSILVLAREIRSGGRSVCRVNGRAVTVKLLESIGQHLVDIHGQTEHLSLMRVREHIDLLDRYGSVWPARDQLAALVGQLRAVRRELADLRRDERELARRLDLLQYQVSEIEAARLLSGEELELAQERDRLANAEQLRDLADGAFLTLYEGDEDRPSAVDLLQVAARALGGLARLDPLALSLAEAADTANYQIEDLAESLRDYREQIEFNPRRLDQVEDRLALIRSLQRKYGETIEDVLVYAERAQQELETIEHSEERIEELMIEEDRLLHEIGAQGMALSQRRQAAGQRLAESIEAELAELSMDGARFGVDLTWREAEDGAYAGERRLAFDLTGLDRVEFLVAPNVGEPLKPLVRVASGGETSRLMLALKTVLAQADRTPTLIFDEIDSGIGGRVGAVVGHKLWSLTTRKGSQGRPHQVLCVTHLAQLAGYGDLHLQVRKGIHGERTVTSVACVQGQEREQEIAGMLGSVTQRTRASAREMLAASQEKKRQ
jgi:DNA repair protein RecN (Recombination protein N)